MSMTVELRPLLTKAEVADLYHVSVRTIDRLRERGVLPFLIVGSAVRFRPEDVEALMNPDARPHPVDSSELEWR